MTQISNKQLPVPSPDPSHHEFATPQETLPLAALVVLAMTGFTAILTETLPAGLLPQIAQGLGVSQSLAGQTGLLPVWRTPR